MGNATQAEMLKIADRISQKNIREYPAFAKIGFWLKTNQDEIRALKKRIKLLESEMKSAVRGFKPPDMSKKNAQNPTISSPAAHLTTAEIRKIRLARSFSLREMGIMLDVSLSKYSRWESGRNLMAPCVEEKLIEIRDMKASVLREKMQKKGIFRPSGINTPIMRKNEKKQTCPAREKMPKEDIQFICDGLNLSQQGLANLLGIDPHVVANWLYSHSAPSPEMMLKLRELHEKVSRLSPKEKAVAKLRAAKRVKTILPRDCVTPDEIKEILAKLQWTMRQLAAYVHTETEKVKNWKYGFCKPSTKMTNKLREVQHRMELGELKSEYDGPLVTVAEVKKITNTLKWSSHRLAVSVGLTKAHVRDWFRGIGSPNAHESKKLREVQQKIQSGALKAKEVLPKVSPEQIREICKRQRLTHHTLSKKLKKSAKTIGNWLSGRKFPGGKTNILLWDLWNAPPLPPLPILRAEELYACRKQLNLTQGEFASQFGISRSCYSSWERGFNKPSLDICNKIRNFCGLPIPSTGGGDPE